MQNIDVSNLPSSEVKKLKDKNKSRKDVVFISKDDNPGDNKGLNEVDEFSSQYYDKLKKHFTEKGFQKSLTKLEDIKYNTVSLIKVYNSYFRDPYQREDLYMMRESKIRSYINKCITILQEEIKSDEIGSLESMPTDDDVMIQRFPQLKEALKELLSKDYKAFISDIKYIAPKPTTFQIVVSDENFNLIWGGKAFICEVQGKKYFLMYDDEKIQAIKAINRLLRLGSNIADKKTGDSEGVEQSVVDSTPPEKSEFSVTPGEEKI
jgi:hypothetical protein